MWLKQSTSVVIQFGPFVDKADGVTLETGLVSALDNASTGIMLSKNGGTLAVRHATVTASSYDAHGCYKVTLDTTDTGTLGKLRVIYTDAATCLPVWRDFDVVPAMIYDSMIAGSDRLDTNVTHIADTSQTARDIGASVLLSSGTGTGQVKLSSGYVAPNWGDVGNPTTVVGLSGTTVKTATDVETDTADIQTRLPAALVSGRMDSSVGAMAADVLTAAATAADFGTEIGTAVWATTTRQLTGTQTFNVTGNITGNLSGSVGSVTGNVGGNVAGTVAGVTPAAAGDAMALTSGERTTLAAVIWNSLTSGMTTAGSIGKKLADWTIHSAADVWAVATRTLTAATNITSTGGTTVPQTGDAYARLGAPAGASVSADVAAVKTDTAATLLYGTRTIARGTVGSATSPSVTQFTPSALSPSGAAADQFKGRIIIFDNDTATAALRGQATDITANSNAALPLFTMTDLTTAPQSGDTFSIE